MTGQLNLVQQLEEILKIADEEILLAKDDFGAVAEEVAPRLEFTADDWIKGFYPSETASIALTERDPNKNIIRTGIAALYNGFPIVVADNTGCYVYEDYGIEPVVSVNRDLVDNLEIPVRCHVFGQKPTPHWVWMNEIISFLNKAGIRTDNNMGPYFLLRNFFYYNHITEKGIEISPMKGVVLEPFCNKSKEEIGAFIINALNKKLSIEKQFFISNMSGEELFDNGIIKKMDSCEIYCASGWIVGPNKKLVSKVLSATKEAVEILGKPEDTNEKINRFINDLDHLKLQP